jgi:hypothetical protein
MAIMVLVASSIKNDVQDSLSITSYKLAMFLTLSYL